MGIKYLLTNDFENIRLINKLYLVINQLILQGNINMTFDIGAKEVKVTCHTVFTEMKDNLTLILFSGQGNCN